jgi:hypothetical protein
MTGILVECCQIVKKAVSAVLPLRREQGRLSTVCGIRHTEDSLPFVLGEGTAEDAENSKGENGERRGILRDLCALCVERRRGEK